MKNCVKCGTPLDDEALYCKACNTNQMSFFDEFEPPVYSDTFLKVLCVLTIIGAVFGLISAMASIAGGVGLPIEGLKVVTYISTGVAIGKLTGAIFMLQKKLNGLYIYTAAAILGLIMQVYSVVLTSGYMESLPGMSNTIVIISTAFAVVFFLAFLIMYWLPVNRRLLW